MSFNVEFFVQKHGNRRFKAIARCNGHDESAAGSSPEVACTAALRTLLAIPGVTKNKEPVQVEILKHDPNAYPQFEVCGGAHDGQVCTLIRDLGTMADGSHKYEVRYTDGTTGKEKPEFLRPL